MIDSKVIRTLRARVRADQRVYTRARGCKNYLIIIETTPFIKLVIVFTRAAPALEDLFNTVIWFLLDINTVHTYIKKETFEYLLKLTSM